MADVAVPKSWRDELASLIEDSGIRLTTAASVNAMEISTPAFSMPEQRSPLIYDSPAPPESLKDQIKGFTKAWGEMLMELMRGCRDVVQQSGLFNEESYIVKKTKAPFDQVSRKLSVFNDFLPEDRHPVHAWPLIFFVFILALSGNFYIYCQCKEFLCY